MKIHFLFFLIILLPIKIVSQTSQDTTNCNYYKLHAGFNIKLKAGLNESSISITLDNYVLYSTKYPNYNIDLGIEAEYILPVKNNYLGIFIEPTCFGFNHFTSFPTSKINIKYSALKTPIGVRYFIPTNTSNLYLFIEGFYVTYLNLTSNPKIDFSDQMYDDLRIHAKGNLGYGFGIGYKLISLGFRHCFKNELYKYDVWYSDFQNNSLVLGFRVSK